MTAADRSATGVVTAAEWDASLQVWRGLLIRAGIPLLIYLACIALGLTAIVIPAAIHGHWPIRVLGVVYVGLCLWQVMRHAHTTVLACAWIVVIRAIISTKTAGDDTS